MITTTNKQSRAWDSAIFERENAEATQNYGRMLTMAGLWSKYGHAVPTKVALRSIKQFLGANGIIEIGAGTGYWARCLSELKVNIIATDINPPQASFFDVRKKDGSEAASLNPDKALMICMPDVKPNYAFKALEAHYLAGGEKVVFIGEPAGRQTATADFYKFLYANYSVTEACSLPWVGFPFTEGLTKVFLGTKKVSK